MLTYRQRVCVVLLHVGIPMLPFGSHQFCAAGMAVDLVLVNSMKCIHGLCSIRGYRKGKACEVSDRKRVQPMGSMNALIIQ